MYSFGVGVVIEKEIATTFDPPLPRRWLLKPLQLANLEVGGTKGKVLTTSVSQIHMDFGLAVAAVKEVDYDVMDLHAATAFEFSFQTFR